MLTRRFLGPPVVHLHSLQWRSAITVTKTIRGIDEGEAAILDAEFTLIQSLFDYGSATPPPGLRKIT